MTWQQIIHTQFPQARCLSAARQALLEWLEGECASDRVSTLLATSTCSDDIIASKDISRDFAGPFALGGLAGFPFAGLTGMGAYAHHIPDNGTSLVFYGPHIGVTRQGVWGKMRRHGQSHETQSCGALMAALDRMRGPSNEEPDVPCASDDDQQQMFLQQALMPFKDRILAAASPEMEITTAAYRLIDDQIRHLVEAQRSQFHGDRILLIGGVIINTDPDSEDWVDVRNRQVVQ